MLSRCSNNIHWDGILKEGNEVAGTVSQDFENSEYAAFIRMEKSHGCCRVPFMHWKKTMKIWGKVWCGRASSTVFKATVISRHWRAKSSKSRLGLTSISGLPTENVDCPALACLLQSRPCPWMASTQLKREFFLKMCVLAPCWPHPRLGPDSEKENLAG